MNKIFSFMAIFFISNSIVFSMPVVSKTTVPFPETWIPPHTSLLITYKNVDHWDTIVCGCNTNQQCSNYVATWKFKKEKMQSNGPNYFRWLELYLGLPPETPHKNADENGHIEIYNTGRNSMPISCNFDILNRT